MRRAWDSEARAVAARHCSVQSQLGGHTVTLTHRRRRPQYLLRWLSGESDNKTEFYYINAIIELYCQRRTPWRQRSGSMTAASRNGSSFHSRTIWPSSAAWLERVALTSSGSSTATEPRRCYFPTMTSWHRPSPVCGAITWFTSMATTPRWSPCMLMVSSLLLCCHHLTG